MMRRHRSSARWPAACYARAQVRRLLHHAAETMGRHIMRMAVEAFAFSRFSRRVALAAAAVTVAGGLMLGAAAAAERAAMLLPGSVNDQSWNAVGFAGLSKLKDMGFEIAYSENVSPADQIE